MQAENKIYSKKLVSSTIKCRQRVKSMSKFHSLFTLPLSIASKKWVICRKLVVFELAFYPLCTFYCAGHRLFSVYFILCLNFMIHIQFTFYCRDQPLLKYRVSFFTGPTQKAISTQLVPPNSKEISKFTECGKNPY